MPHGLMTVALATAMQVGQPSPSETPNYPALQNAYNQYGFEGKYEQRYPFDTQQNWVHGYHQEIPAYGGHVFFRPYNYKDVLSQSQTAAGWGMSPTMPYSQQFWHRYQYQIDLSQGGGVGTMPTPAPVPVEVPDNNSWVPVQPAPIYTPINYQYPAGYIAPAQQTPIQQYIYGR